MKTLIISMLLFVAIYISAQQTQWANSIANPENEEFVVECAFNENVPVEKVTQAMFDKRYGPFEAATTRRLIHVEQWDSTTNLDYDDMGTITPIYVTKNARLYVPRCSKKTGNYYRKYIKLN